jgi:hydroxypyruvate reductase
VDLRADLLAIVRAGIAAVDAGPLVSRALTDVVKADGPRCTCIAAGKAAVAMAHASVSRLGPQIQSGLVVSTIATPVGGFEAIASGHPVPNAESERAGRRALETAESLGPNDTLLVLLSGGASALMAVPAEGVTLDDKRATTNQLLRAGADIYALNTVRKHLSAIKGGWLAARTKGTCHALAISDVVGDDLSVIASGPTVADASTFEDALDVVRRFGGPAAFPPAVVVRLQRGAAHALPDTPKPQDPRLDRSTTTLIGSRRDAMFGAAAEAGSRGYGVIRIDDAVTGEARTTAPAHVRAVLARAAGAARPLCVVSSGETTVHVTGSGKGGRNQEFALAAALSLSEHEEPSPVLASIGTDGIDGPTDAAGAIVDGSTLARARAAGLAPERFLSDNNAYAFFHALGDLIHTGPTGTNVGDLQVILLA